MGRNLVSSSVNACEACVVFDIDGVLRDVSGSYRRALADTVEQFTQGAYRPSSEEIDALKREGIWNNDWEGSQELIYRYFEAQGQARDQIPLSYDTIVTFFQQRYRGPNPENPDFWTGYISQEPLLVTADYFQRLSAAGIAWGFFSGATRGSAGYVLQRRLGLENPVLVAMEDAPGKPDPTGLFVVVEHLTQAEMLSEASPVIYLGDTVADMYTVTKAQDRAPERRWIGLGILPPHVQTNADYAAAYAASLRTAGAIQVFSGVEQVTPEVVMGVMGGG